MLKKATLVFLFVFLLTIVSKTVVFADDGNVKGIYIYEAAHVSQHTEGQAIFLFSDGLLTSFSGDLILVGSNVKIEEQASGRVFSIVSGVSLPDNSQAVVYSVGAYGVRVLFSVLGIALAFFYTAVRRSFFEQGSTVLLREPLRTVSGGILFYFLMLALIIVFALSVVGFPVALVLLLLLVLFISCGHTALGVMFGEIFADKLHVTTGFYQNLFIGLVFIELIKYIPYAEWALHFVVFPILSLGVLANTFINGFIKKIFYPTRYSYYEAEARREYTLERRERVKGMINENR